jgi:hypothetical protein
MAQVRFVNEHRSTSKKLNKPKEVKKILKAKGKETMLDIPRTDSSASDSTASRAVVSVTLHTGKTQGDVKITEDTTVASVTSKLNVPAGYCLAEVGGNIGARRLDPVSRLYPLLEVNQHLTFVVMPESRFTIAH